MCLKFYPISILAVFAVGSFGCVIPCGTLEGKARIESSRDVEKISCYEQIDGDLTINSAHGLETMALPLLEEINGNLLIACNTNLIDLKLQILSIVRGKVSVIGNQALQDLDGLQSLKKVDDDLTIEGNATCEQGKLKSLGGLSNLSIIGGDVIVRNNPNLPSCDVDALIQQLREFNGLVINEQNLPCI